MDAWSVSKEYSHVGNTRACFQSMAEQDLSQSEKTLHIVYLTSCLGYSSIFAKYNRCLDDNEELFRNVDQCWVVEFLTASRPIASIVRLTQNWQSGNPHLIIPSALEAANVD